MKIAQILIILISLGILFFGLNERKTSVGRAWKKIGLIVLVLAMIVTVLYPSAINSLAHLLGVGRGADLLLYILTLAFISYALSSYLHQQSERDALYRIAREFAIHEANARYKINANKND